MIITFLFPGFESIECLKPIEALRKANIPLTTVAIGSEAKEVKGAFGISVLADMTERELCTKGDFPECVEYVLLPTALPEQFNSSATPFTNTLIHLMRERGVTLELLFVEKLLAEEDVTGEDTTVEDMATTVQETVSGTKGEETEESETYLFPPLSLLNEPKSMDGQSETEAQGKTIEKLQDIFASASVEADITGCIAGPRVTRYEIVPKKGTRVRSILNLMEDIALEFGNEGLRMENKIPEKNAIGLEIPNASPTLVRMRELASASEFSEAMSKTVVCIGKDVTGGNVCFDLAKFPHLIVAGATGMGKSVCIHAMLTSLLLRARPDEVRLLLIDPKKVEFESYADIPHLLVPIITESKEAAGALMWVIEEVERRYDLLESCGVRNLDAYNDTVRKNPSIGKPMAKIIVAIDELNDLMMQVRDPVESLILRIAQKSRAAGIHLIIGTQRPSPDVLTGVIKANIPSRISFKVSSSCDSETVLDVSGAEQLLNRGDMLFSAVGYEPKRVQGVYISDDEVTAVTDFLREQSKGKTVYDAIAVKEIGRLTRERFPAPKKPDASDFLSDTTFCEAVWVVIGEERALTSLLQRRLSIGFGKAASYIDAMEELGIVGARCGQKPREVLIDAEEFAEMLDEYEFTRTPEEHTAGQDPCTDGWDDCSG